MTYQNEYGLFHTGSMTVLDQNTDPNLLTKAMFTALHRTTDVLLKTSASTQQFLSQQKDLESDSKHEFGSESDVPSDEEETQSESALKPADDDNDFEIFSDGNSSDESDLDDEDTEPYTEQNTKSSPLLLYLEEHEPYLKQTIQKVFIPTYLNQSDNKEIDKARECWINTMKAEIKTHLTKAYEAHLKSIQSADPYQILPRINQDDAFRTFIYKELAAWQLLIKTSLEDADLTPEQSKAYQQDLNTLFHYNEYCYLLQRDKANSLTRFCLDLNHGFLYHPWMQSCFDSEKDVLPLNLAPYEWFDTVKQRMSLLKVTERLFGVQTVYFLETLFYTIDGSAPPVWLLFLKDGVFFWLNFVLQTIDSTIFALGAIITSHDIGSRRWLKVIFAFTFWLCALLPILGIAPAFFKFTAILAGMLKSLLDMRHYYLNKNQNQFEIEGIHFELKSIEKDLEIDAHNYFDLLFRQFKLRKKLMTAREKAKQAQYRIRDKSVALFASCLALVAMIMAAFLPITILAITWMICSLFIITTAIKFFYRAATYNNRVQFGLVEAGITHETCLKELDEIKKDASLKSQFHLFNAKDEHYQAAKKSAHDLKDTELLKLHEKKSFLYKLFFASKSDFHAMEKTLALIESAFDFDSKLFQTLSIYSQLKSLAKLKSEEAFYKRTDNQKGIEATQGEITALRLALKDQDTELEACLKEIYHIATILSQDYFSCRIFLMALFHDLEDIKGTPRTQAKERDKVKSYSKSQLNNFFKSSPEDEKNKVKFNTIINGLRV